LLTGWQRSRLNAVFADERHLEVQVTWTIYQRIVAACRNPDRTAAKAAFASVIKTISRGAPAQLRELAALGRTLTRRAVDVLAYFDRPSTSNGPTEAINGRLEHLRGTPTASATSPTTSPAACSTPAASGPECTLFCDEPA